MIKKLVTYFLKNKKNKKKQMSERKFNIIAWTIIILLAGSVIFGLCRSFISDEEVVEQIVNANTARLQNDENVHVKPKKKDGWIYLGKGLYGKSFYKEGSFVYIVTNEKTGDVSVSIK